MVPECVRTLPTLVVSSLFSLIVLVLFGMHGFSLLSCSSPTIKTCSNCALGEATWGDAGEATTTNDPGDAFANPGLAANKAGGKETWVLPPDPWDKIVLSNEVSSFCFFANGSSVASTIEEKLITFIFKYFTK